MIDLSTVVVSSAPSLCLLQSQFLKIFAEHTNDCNVASSITETCQRTGQTLSSGDEMVHGSPHGTAELGRQGS